MSDTGRAPRVPGLEDFERIGSGGFSTVYRAYDPQFDRVVAVKILNLAVSDPDAQRKFLRECRLMGRLGSHPHVLTVFAADVLPDDRPYIVMEYLEGGTVADLAPLPQDEVLRTGILVGSALASVHAADVVHRDVKPQNILLSAYGQPVLGDFGVSGVVQQDGSVSTPTALSPLYAAPEAFHGIPDQASDQYSLGATLYALLAGRSPADVGAEGPFPQIMLRVLEHDASPLPPTVADPRLAKVVHRALAKAPQDRFPDVAALVDALQQVQRDLGLPVTASVAAPTPTARREQIGEGARISTRPPLGGARTPGTGAPATEPPVAGDHTVPVGWPSTPVDANEAPHFADATHDKSSRMPDSETMGATRTTRRQHRSTPRARLARRRRPRRTTVVDAPHGEGCCSR